MFNIDILYKIKDIEKTYLSLIIFTVAYIVACIYSYNTQTKVSKMKVDDDYDPDAIFREPDESLDDQNCDFNDDLRLLNLTDDDDEI